MLILYHGLRATTYCVMSKMGLDHGPISLTLLRAHKPDIAL